MNIYEIHQARQVVSDFILLAEGLTLDSGRIYSVVGPNGSGKSTFLNLLSFLDPPSAGIVSFYGEPVDYHNHTAMRNRRRQVAYLMQDPYLFRMNVYDNIRFGPRLRGDRSRRADDMVNRTMTDLAIMHLARKPSHELSRGEVQRVALARTIALNTEILILDEPTAYVDKANVLLIEDALLSLSKNQGRTIIFSTHSDSQSLRLSDSVVTILDGAAAQSDIQPPLEV